jgi:hypothetical protein
MLKLRYPFSDDDVTKVCKLAVVGLRHQSKLATSSFPRWNIAGTGPF